MLVRVLMLVALFAPVPALAQLRWEEGRHYTTLSGATAAAAQPGRIEVAEVFSYGCIHCYRAKDAITKLKQSLPADAVMNYVHASFLPAEGWPVFQRAWYTAQSLGIGDALHDQMFDAVWKTGELPLVDPATGAIRKPLPGIEDIARFYARVGSVTAADFVKLANSAAIEAQMQRADALVKSWLVPGTPALIVNGRYLVDNASVASWDELRQLVTYLVGRERLRLKLPAAAQR